MLPIGTKRRAFHAPALARPSAAAKTLPQRSNENSTYNANNNAVRSAEACSTEDVLYFTVLYTKYAPNKLRKNKSYADGVLEASSVQKSKLFDDGGKLLAASVLRGVELGSLGHLSELQVGSWEVEVQAVLSPAAFRSGQAFLGVTELDTSQTAAAEPPRVSLPSLKPRLATAAGSSTGPRQGFKKHLPGSLGVYVQAPPPRPMHDPHAPDAVVLNAEQWAGGAGKDDARSGALVIPVVLDPFLGRRLRPHQVQGVRFMYACLETGSCQGPTRHASRGCILADDMGLGKTVQVLALLWTLLRQGSTGKPVIRKALVVAPATLVENWGGETSKWLGSERVRPVLLPSGPDVVDKAREFRHAAAQKLAVTSYETLRRISSELRGGVDLLVCDEAHCLKSLDGSKTMTALESLLCPRRVLLTGTPVQNAPREFFALADFASPGSLGSFETFQTVFGRPILQARERHASAAAVELGAARARELQERVSRLLLRRTAETNAAFLPELSTYVVFCRPAPAQLARYRDVLKAYHASRGGTDGDALAVIVRLRQLCSHPCLERLEEADEGRKQEQTGDPDVLSRDSGKLAALRAMLGVWASARDRCVVVSQSTATLDLVAGLCASLSLRCARLDGGTEVSKRHDIVEAFNSHGIGDVFLLSTAAGGAGLNLTGASRLVLFDSHWNPALDQQAMARIWRDGQNKPCVVYRLLLTGTIEEKTYQRQLRKSEVASELGMRVKDAREDAQLRRFSEQDLKKLFELREHTDCDTYDVLQAAKDSSTPFANVAATVDDPPLCAALDGGCVTFVHLETAPPSMGRTVDGVDE